MESHRFVDFVHGISCYIFLFSLKVCNLKEEVSSYQLHKQSEDQLQAVGDMLSVEKASKCDAAEECHLKK
jgi:hypothetical protein